MSEIPPVPVDASIKESAAVEAEKLKESAVTTAEKLKESAATIAVNLKENAATDATNLLKLAETVAKTQLNLLLENAMFKAIFRSINDGAIVTDSKGKVLFYNRAAVELSEQKKPPIIFANYYNLYKPDAETSWPVDQDPLSRAIKGRATVGELMYIKYEHSGIFISCMAVPLSYGIDDSVVGGFIMFRKIQTLTGKY